jgi:hypothetical protein
MLFRKIRKLHYKIAVKQTKMAVDAIGELDGLRCIIDWKTTTARYTDNPAGLLALDP